ncbi:FecR domain-containing protein [Caulobacter segnis]|uniref:FecR protein n=1 Tax=Caulobacter segnis TaxID=88688 RepID=A0A2W5V6P3_9CAUL|nr:FecR domain-containing protein [Caulobacter segnis]PZR35490.1 MAG: FecR protein [Caulobacter segnis]
MTPGDEEHLRREAAAWFARMRGPGAEAARSEFDAWRAGPGRQGAYDRLVQRFEESAVLGHSRLSDLRLRTSAARRGPPPAVWWTAAAAGLVLGAVALTQTLRAPVTEAVGGARYVSTPGQIRTIALAPDLTVVLDTDTVLTASTRGDRQRLVLERGRVRVQAERPLEVDADGARVVAARAAFDMRRQGGQDVELSILQGEVQAEGGGLLRRPRTRVGTGQRLILTGGRPGLATPAPTRDRQWPTGLLVFDGAPLGQVVAEANRYGYRKIRLADPALGRLQVSGGLKVTDPDGLARALAAALGLTISAAPGGDLVLARTDA